MTIKGRRSKALFEEDQLHDSGIHEVSTSLLSDPHFIAAASSRPIAPHAVTHGRRILHVAWMLAKDAEHEAKVLEEAIPDFERVGDLAAAAARPLGKLVDALARNHRREKIDGFVGLIAPLMQMTSHLDPKSPPNERLALAERQAQALFETSTVVSAFARHAGKRRKTLASGRHNAGRVDKAAFLRALAEGWLFLTGRLPGLGTDRNPFLRLAEAGWEDCGGSPDESFASQLRPLVRQMRRDPQYQTVPYVPDWI